MALFAKKVSAMCQRKTVQGKRETRTYMPGGWLDNCTAPYMGNIPDACRNYNYLFPQNRRDSSVKDINRICTRQNVQPDLIPTKDLKTTLAVNIAREEQQTPFLNRVVQNEEVNSVPISPVSETAKVLGDKVCCGCGRIKPTYLSKMFHSVDDYNSSFDSIQFDVRNFASAFTAAHLDMLKSAKTTDDRRMSTVSQNTTASELIFTDRTASSPCSTNPDVKKCICSRCSRKRSKCNRKVRFSDDLTNSFSRVEMWVASMDSTNPPKQVYEAAASAEPQQCSSSSPSPTDAHMSSPSQDDLKASMAPVLRPDPVSKMTESISSDRSSISTALDDEEIDVVETGLQVPIVGYEVMEQRARFTVFKVHVQRSRHENWFVFRRYTDFVQLNDKLKEIYPGFRLSLPPKRWFGSNFDENFLEERAKGLQAFLNNITGHRDVSQSKPVRQFLCLDDPPGPHDSLEESRALCESLEETVYNMRRDLQERDSKIELLEGEIAMYKAQIDALNSSLRMEREYHRRQHSLSASKAPSECSLGDMEDTDAGSCIEADQFPINKRRTSSENSVEWEINRNITHKETLNKTQQNHNKLPALDGSGDTSSLLAPS
ncbi:uncharacterized protein LOC141900979 isoform X2 [Tubulanus polymorphus]|uniref:uncharacterized protein LOC141900979 isoform X2 n=1 Tax=Tubulanus polymorphus TaxID=672921 RepID=UPI003DA1F519